MGKIVISENVSLDGLGAGERLFGETSDKKPNPYPKAGPRPNSVPRCRVRCTWW
jgi:hypothetical protein